MSDINEAIARWMGWPNAECSMCKVRYYDELADDYNCAHERWPRYDESLDAQVPVWEALERALAEEIEVAFTISPARPEATINAGYEVWTKQADTPAEAAARVTHAALVAMGEVKDTRLQCNCKPYLEQGACVHTVM